MATVGNLPPALFTCCPCIAITEIFERKKSYSSFANFVFIFLLRTGEFFFSRKAGHSTKKLLSEVTSEYGLIAGGFGQMG
jgi:hypothetical protein